MSGRGAVAEPSLVELIRQLSSDTADLIHQEASLAKAEAAQTGKRLGRDAAGVAVGAGVALAGWLALTAFLVVGLGNLLGDNYWLAALIVGVVLLVAGGLTVRGAMIRARRRGLKPQQTLDTLRENASWAKQERRDLRSDLTTTTAPHTAADRRRSNG
ncbi:MAG TPA: phage holin family protein [Gemmatimonadaceae bacterium]|nr:phage holin family protein [Gemmatimonadaceae bacterium]